MEKSKFGHTKPKTYLSKAVLKQGAKLLFTTGGSWARKDFSEAQDGSKEKDVYIVMASLNGEEPKELTINATSGNSLAELWGEEGQGWVNKIAEVNYIKMQCFGKMQDVLCLVPTSDKPEDKQTEPDWT